MTTGAALRTGSALILALALAPSTLGCDCGGGTGGDDAGADAARVTRDAYVDDTNEVPPDAVHVARDPDRCRVEPGDIYLLGSDDDTATSERIVDVAANAAEFAAVWRERVEGIAQIRMARIPSTAGEPSALELTGGAALHDEPTIATVDGQYLVAWRDNSESDFEIFARPVVDGAPGEIARLTTRAGNDASPSLVGVGSSVIASWIEERGAELARVPVTQLLSATGAASGATHDISAPATVQRPTLSPRDGGAMLAYTESGTTRAVSLQRLDGSGAPTGTPDVASTENNALGDVDVGLTSADGAAVFSTLISGVRRQVSIRRLDGTGRPNYAEYPISGLDTGSEQGDSPSVARLREAVGWSAGCRDGYAVAYRSHPTGGADTVLRLVLLDAGTARVRAVDLAVPDISDRGGRVTLRIAGDGQLLVAWTDARSDRVDMRAARIRCD